MVSAEMLNCKLLSTEAAGIKHLYFLHDVLEFTNGQPWQNSRTMCSGEELNVIARKLSLCYISIKND
jgi:hypothetical protein